MMPLPGLLGQRKRYKTIYSAQTEREDLLFVLFLMVVGSRRIFLFRSFQYFKCMDELVSCKQVVCSFHTIRNKCKIFTTISSTAFVHMTHYSQHRMTDPQRGFNQSKSVSFLKTFCSCLDTIRLMQHIVLHQNIY